MSPSSKTKVSSFFIKSNIVDMLIATVLTGLLLLLYILMSKVVLQFSEINDGFGIQIPAITTFLYQYYIWLPVFYLIAKVSFIIHFLKRFFNEPVEASFWKIIKVNIAIFIVVLIAVIVIVYLPIFSYGDVIG